MKATELRIGNKLQKDNSEIFTVLRLDNTNDVLVEEQKGLLSLNYNLQGIPLTEEWLLKLGFEHGEKIAAHNRFVWYKDHIGISGMLGVVKPIECKYVHQLQNLYFALTGEELIVSSNRDSKN